MTDETPTPPVPYKPQPLFNDKSAPSVTIVRLVDGRFCARAPVRLNMATVELDDVKKRVHLVFPYAHVDFTTLERMASGIEGKAGPQKGDESHPVDRLPMIKDAQLIPWEPDSYGGVSVTFEGGRHIAFPLTMPSISPLPGATDPAASLAGLAMGQAYQVIGTTWSRDIVDSGELQRALDYFGRNVYDENFLPWPRTPITLPIDGDATDRNADGPIQPYKSAAPGDERLIRDKLEERIVELLSLRYGALIGDRKDAASAIVQMMLDAGGALPLSPMANGVSDPDLRPTLDTVRSYLNSRVNAGIIDLEANDLLKAVTAALDGTPLVHPPLEDALHAFKGQMVWTSDSTEAIRSMILGNLNGFVAFANEYANYRRPKIIEAASGIGFDWALTIEWPNGTETVEHVSEATAQALGFRNDIDTVA